MLAPRGYVHHVAINIPWRDEIKGKVQKVIKPPEGSIGRMRFKTLWSFCLADVDLQHSFPFIVEWTWGGGMSWNKSTEWKIHENMKDTSRYIWKIPQAVVYCDLKGMARGSTVHDMALNTLDLGRNYILAAAGNKLLVSFAPVGGKKGL